MAWISRSGWLFYRQLTVELHERWLADLRSERMKDKLALSEGKITSEEYMDNKTINLDGLNITELYRIRNWASKSKSKGVVLRIKDFLNGRSGAFGTSDNSFPLVATNIDDVLAMRPPEVWIIVDHDITDTSVAENRSHVLHKLIHDKFGSDVAVKLFSGEIDVDRLENYHVVLLALPVGFFVLKARGTDTVGKAILNPGGMVGLSLGGPELTGYTTLTARCRAEFSREVKPLSPDNDPGQFYTQGIKPLMPYEAPGYGYTLSAEAEEARVQLEQIELAKMSIARFGFLLVYPETGLIISKEDQDKHAEKMVAPVLSRKE